ncbi:MAG: hypothetical protein P8X52_04015 [Limibacillus sp.]
MAGNGGDHRLGAGGDGQRRVPNLGQARGDGCLIHVLHGAEVAPGAEMPARTGQHHGCHRVIGGGCGESGPKLGAQFPIDGVARFGPVEG